MSNDFEDLIGDDPNPSVGEKPKRVQSDRTPRGIKLYDGVKQSPKAVKFDTPLESEFIRPVSASFLAAVMGKQAKQIAKRLVRCEIIGHRKWGNKDVPLYDFMDAMSYLVEPKGNIDEWFAQQNQASLPPVVSKAYWDSAHQRNRVLRSSNDLWHSEDVLSVMGRVAIMIKEESLQWIENMPGKDQLTNDQYASIVDSVHELQDRIRDRMTELANEGTTLSMAHSIREEIDTAKGAPEGSLE